MRIKNNEGLVKFVNAQIAKGGWSKYGLADAIAKRFGHTQSAVLSRIKRMDGEGRVSTDFIFELASVLGFTVELSREGE